MQKLIWVDSKGNSIDLTSGNYGITNWEGFSNTSLNIQSQQVPFQDGSVFLDALIEQRELSVTLAIQDNGNLETRYRLRRELIHILNPKSGEGYLIYKNDFTQKRIKCISQIPLFENHNSNDSGTPKASLSWTACEPYWEDLEPVIVPLYPGQRFTVENVGDVKTGFEVEFFNDNVVNPKITNYTQNKSVELKGTFNQNILIDSNFGKKRIYEKALTQKILNKTFVMNDCIYIDDFGAYVGVSDDSIYYSTDARTFKSIKSPSLNKLKSLVYNNVNKVLYCFGEGVIVSTNDLVNIQVLVDNDINVFNGGTVTPSGNLILVGQNSSTEKAFIHRDFNNVYTSSNNMNLKSVIELNGKIIAVGSYNGAGIIVESTDFTTWTETTKTEELNTIARSDNGNYVVIGGNNGYGLYLDNGSWEVSDISDFGQPSNVNTIKLMFIKLEDSPSGGFVGIGDNNEFILAGNGIAEKVYHSEVFTDEKMTTFAYSSTILTDNRGTYLVFGNGGTIVATIQINLSGNIISYGKNLKKIIYSEKDKLFIAISDNDILTIDDNGNYNIIYSSNQYTFNSITYSEYYNMCVVVGNVILTSLNLSDWRIAEELPSEAVLNDVSCHDVRIVAVGGWGEGVYASDLIYVYSNGGWINRHAWLPGVPPFLTIDFSEKYNNFYILVGNREAYAIANGYNCDYDYKPFSEGGQINFVSCLNDKLIIGTEAGIYVREDYTENLYLRSSLAFSKLFYDKNLKVYTAYNVSDYVFYVSFDLSNWIAQETMNGVQDISSTENKTIAVGNGGLIMELFSELKANIISSLSTDSDMAIGLEIGTNEMLISNTSGNMIAKIKYTPKYIGV